MTVCQAVSEAVINIYCVEADGVIPFIGIRRACIVVPKFQCNLFVGLLDIRILTVQVEVIFDLHRFFILSYRRFQDGNKRLFDKLL